MYLSTATPYVYLSPATLRLVPALVVTRTSTLPVPAGAVTWMVVEDFTRTCVADFAPNLTCFTTFLPLILKCRPVMVTVVPPLSTPVFGLTEVTAGLCWAANAEAVPARPMMSTATRARPTRPAPSEKTRLSIPASR